MLSENFIQACRANGFKEPQDDNSWKQVLWNLTYNDPRYEDKESAKILEVYLRNGAVEMDRLEFRTSFNDIKKVVDADMELRMNKRQTYPKAVMAIGLEHLGFVVDGFESRVYAGIADVVGHKDKLMAVGECSMCRLNKVGATLACCTVDKVYQLWHLPTWPYHGDSWGERRTFMHTSNDDEKQPFVIYVYRKGANYDRLTELLNKTPE